MERLDSRDERGGGRIRLTLLGQVDLSDDSGRRIQSVLSQPKRVALLAYVAMAGRGRFVRRDELTAVFWPRRNDDRARKALRDALYFLRRALGDDILLTPGDEVGLDWDRFECDAVELLEAVEAGDEERAREVYGGELLPGFHVSGARPFEEWVEGVRGEIAGATRELRQPTSGATEPGHDEAESDARSIPNAHGVPTAPSAPPGRSTLRKPVVLAVALAAVVSWGLLRPTSRAPEAPPSPYRVAVFPFETHVGSELTYLSAGVAEQLGRAIDGAGEFRRVDPHALRAEVQRSGSGPLDPTRAAELAMQFGAGRFVLGIITSAGKEVGLSMSLFDVTDLDEPVATAAAEGPFEELSDIIRQAALEALQTLPLGEGMRLSDLTRPDTEEWGALKAYLEAEAHMHEAEYDAAVDDFHRAIALDSVFALAWYRQGFAVEWAAQGRGDAYYDRAEALIHRLSERDSMIVAAFQAFRAARWEEADSIASHTIGHYPDDVEAWHILGITRLWYNPFQGRPMVEARVPLERALSLDPTHPLARFHMSTFFGVDERWDSLMVILGEADQTRNQPWWPGIRASIGIAHGSGSRDSIFQTLEQASDGVLVTASNVHLFTRDWDGQDRLLAMITDRVQRPAHIQALGHRQRVVSETQRGRWTRVPEAADRVAGIDPTMGLVAKVESAVLPLFEQAVSADDLAGIQGEIEAMEDPPTSPSPWMYLPPSLQPHVRSYLNGLVQARLGNSSAVVREVATLRAAGTPETDPVGLLEDLALQAEALEAAMAGDWVQALDRLERMSLRVPHSYHWLDSHIYSRSLARFLRGQALSELGRHEEAIHWLRGLFYGEMFPKFIHFPGAYREIGRAHDALGQSREALWHYQRFVEWWSDADPALRPLVEEVRDRMTALQGSAQ